MTPTPALVVLDVNGTLSDLRGLEDRLAAHGASPTVLDAWFAATLRDGFALTAVGARADFARIGTETLAALLADGSELATDPGAAAADVVGAMSGLDLHPDVVPGLRALAAAGIRVVTLSNGAPRVAEALLERARARELVERCLSADDAGRWKPAPEAYAYAVDACDVAQGEAMLVAVHPWDIDGARRAGLRTGWIARNGGAYPSFFAAPDVRAADLGALAAGLAA